tara:strand:+ start:6535 stop:8424 length:1890 start_codon:yes stop_codon:yes gene_type:complete
MQTDPDSLVGSTLQDRYRIDAFLAEGAMGAVYRAQRIGLERAVAIKFLSASFASSPKAKQRFEREAKVMSQLDHPNCVSVIDFGIAPSPFIVMEFVTGETLRELMDEGPVSVRRSLYLTKGILAGLAHAHELSIVHRDIKPANVMITRAAGTEGLVRILDFGLAKLRDGASSDVSSASIVVGTPNYMSPEQAMGSDVDSRTDIYAAGILLFELLTGSKPYTSDVALHILLQHRTDPIPRLSETAPDREFPQGLQNIIDKAMAKKPEERFASVIEFADAIRALEDGDTALLERLAPEVATRGDDPTVLARPVQKDTSSTLETPIAPAPSKRRSKALLLLLSLPLVAMAVGTSLGYGPLASENDSASPHPLAASAKASSAASSAAQFLGASLEGASEVDAEPQPDAALDLEAAALAAVEVGDDGVEDELDAGSEDSDDFFEFTIDEDEEVEKEEGTLSAEELAADEPNVDPPEPSDSPPPAVLQVRSVADALQLSRQGKREEAISGLRQLVRKQPKNARLSLALGNLYFEQMWWSAGLEQYQEAIRKDRKTRRSPVVIKNAIRALGSSKTRRKAQTLLRKQIGGSGLALLRRAAKRDSSPLVRKRATVIVRQLTRKPKKKKKKRRRPRPRW